MTKKEKLIAFANSLNEQQNEILTLLDAKKEERPLDKREQELYQTALDNKKAVNGMLKTKYPSIFIID